MRFIWIGKKKGSIFALLLREKSTKRERSKRGSLRDILARRFIKICSEKIFKKKIEKIFCELKKFLTFAPALKHKRRQNEKFI